MPLIIFTFTDNSVFAQMSGMYTPEEIFLIKSELLYKFIQEEQRIDNIQDFLTNKSHFVRLYPCIG